MPTMCPGCKEEILPAHVKDFVKQADGSHVVWHNTCNSDRLEAEKSERLHKAETRIAELEAALRSLRLTARILLQNSEGCAVNHYGEDFYLHGEPGWLIDCRTTIERAEAVLGNQETEERENGNRRADAGGYFVSCSSRATRRVIWY